MRNTVGKKSSQKVKIRFKHKRKIRATLEGTTARPRLAIFRSNANIYAQVIDDSKGATLVAASTLDKELGGDLAANIESSKKVGQLIAKRAQAKGIKTVVFDRCGYLYHGKVKALADAAREAGLVF